MASLPRYFLWGVLLGCGVATVIPYTSFIVLLAAEATSGPIIGAILGAVYGCAREVVSLMPFLFSKRMVNSQYTIMSLYERLGPLARRLNLVWILVMAVLLTASVLQ